MVPISPRASQVGCFQDRMAGWGNQATVVGPWTSAEDNNNYASSAQATVRRGTLGEP
jgi:hypothetical protein